MSLKKQTHRIKTLFYCCNSKINHTRDRMDRYEYQKLPHSESKVREISKPVKIAQLLDFPKQLQTGIRDSAVKISQPERITPYVKKSTQKKNDSAVKRSQPERITPYVETTKKKNNSTVKRSQPKRITPCVKTPTQKMNEGNMVNQFHRSDRNVRRNLKFTEIPPTARRIKHFVRASMNNLHNKSTVNERSLQRTRKSFILPPDSIKNMHIAQNRLEKSQFSSSYLNKTRILTEKSISKCVRISEGSESSSSLVENVDTLANNLVVQKKNNKMSVIQHTSSQQTFKANNGPDADILYSSSFFSNVNNSATETVTCNQADVDKAANVNICNNQNSDGNITVDKSQVSSMHNRDMRKDINQCSSNHNCCLAAACTPGVKKMTIGDTRVPLQAIKKISKSCMHLQHGIDDEREYVTLSKKELTILTSNLESCLNLICKLEKDISYLKSTSIDVMNLLSMKNARKIPSDNDNEIESNKQMTESISDNAKIINNTGTTSSSSNQIITTLDNNSECTSKTLGLSTSMCAKTDVSEVIEDHVETQSLRQNDFTPVNNNKENEKDTRSSVKHSKPLRRSARLMTKALKNSDADNDSFVNLEHELNIVSKEFATPTMSYMFCMDHTPLTSGRTNKKTGKPWKEYMAMKSRMSCLLTPNIKRFNPVELRRSIYEDGAIRSLSSKIFADLHNLYSESPDL